VGGDREALRGLLRDVPDFPRPGVLFKDITPLLADAGAFRTAVDAMAEPHADAGIDLVIGLEARGFLFAAPIAYLLGAGCVPFRKPGKLPYETVEHTYDLEYGTDSLAAHVDALEAGPRVLVVDDVLATGGTARAAVDLAQGLGGDVMACSFLLEIAALGGRTRLAGEQIDVLLTVG
jgi:adenine phosphoribosyltransferase